MVKLREEVACEDCWNVEDLYPSYNEWEKAYQDFETKSDNHTWPNVQAFKDTLGQNSNQVKGLLDLVFSISRDLTKLYTYIHLRNDEDIALDKHKSAYQRVVGTYHDFGTICSWIDPELLTLPQSTLDAYLKDPVLADYHFYLEQIFRLKNHTLSADKEELLSMSGKALQSTHKAFSAINDADFSFGEVEDSKGVKHPLTHATFGKYLRDQDRVLRKNAFLTLHGKYKDFGNTLAELLNGTTQAHLFQAKTHKYASCLEAALFPKNIDTSVYHSLIEAVRSNLDAIHQYVKLRKKMMGVDTLHLYDMYVPLCKNVDMNIPYLEAEQLVIDSVAPLGTEYQNILRKGLLEERWVDRYENKNKRSGAYSSGCYDSHPYILMNYKHILRDVFTLAHEAGHSMHSYYSHKNQPYHYGDYPIFLAEVASTFNEQLLTATLLKRSNNRNEKIFLINEKIEDIRATLFRQTMFAEFELFIHECAEKNIPLTPETLKEKYRSLNEAYFGPEVVIDEEAMYEWSRIPHFYYNFYVYQYATGLSASLALYNRVINGGEKERDDYLGFLKSGCSDYPIEILKKAGVDMRSPAPVASAISHFRYLVTELDKLLNEK